MCLFIIMILWCFYGVLSVIFVFAYVFVGLLLGRVIVYLFYIYSIFIICL